MTCAGPSASSTSSPIPTRHRWTSCLSTRKPSSSRSSWPPIQPDRPRPVRALRYRTSPGSPPRHRPGSPTSRRRRPVRGATSRSLSTCARAVASFVAAMLAPADGPRRVLTFIILTVGSDIGGYFAGITLGRGGRHLMAPVISPKKTWEGFAGSAVACLVAGWLCVTLLLHGHAWQGLLIGAAAVLAAILRGLVESVIKRDLDIKDMGTLLPGHGGLLERLDSLLVVAPVAWLLLYLFIPAS